MLHEYEYEYIVAIVEPIVPKPRYLFIVRDSNVAPNPPSVIGLLKNRTIKAKGLVAVTSSSTAMASTSKFRGAIFTTALAIDCRCICPMG